MSRSRLSKPFDDLKVPARDIPISASCDEMGRVRNGGGVSQQPHRPGHAGAQCRGQKSDLLTFSCGDHGVKKMHFDVPEPPVQTV